MNSTRRFQVRLERIRRLSASTLDFRFVRMDGAPVLYRPGQFFRFVFEDGDGEFERSYSLCNFDALHEQYLDLVLSSVSDGRATQYLFNAATGITAWVAGPFGRLVVPEVLPARLVMVATSVGIAPFMPMLRQLEQPLLAGNLKVVLVFGMRDSSEFLYADQLLDYLQRYAGFSLLVCYSREPPAKGRAREYEREGYVNGQFDDLNLDAGQDHVLLCGNPAMVEDGWRYLKDRGFRSAQVVREKYVFAKDKRTRLDKDCKDSPAQTPSEAQKRLIAEKVAKHRNR